MSSYEVPGKAPGKLGRQAWCLPAGAAIVMRKIEINAMILDLLNPIG